ncbi:MAG: phage tail protein [Mesorhizobium sp.]|nr:phage tail protein [Mesorhizobium sp.]
MDDTQRLLVSFEARMTKYERDLARTITGTRTGFRKMEKQAEQTASRMDKVMGGALKSFGKGLAGGIIGGLSVAGINKLVGDIGKVAEGVANIGSAAKRAGMDVKAFQELSHVADQNRISVDALTDGMKELQLRADEFVFTGKGPAAEAFARLGFSASELKRRLADPSALLVEIISRLEQLDRAAQIRISDELFGGTAGERFVELLDRGAAGIRQQIEEANRLGLVLDESVIQRADEIDRKYKLIARTIETEVKGAVVGLASAMLDWWDSLNTIEEQQSRTVQLALQGTYDKIATLNDQIAKLERIRTPQNTAEIDFQIGSAREEIETLKEEALRLRDVLDRRNGYDESFIYETGKDAKATTPPVNTLNNALANTGTAGSGAVSGINSYADAIRALMAEIPELAEQLATLDARTRIDAVYRQALQKARTMGEVYEAGRLRDSALSAVASSGIREAASRGMLDLIGYAEGTDKGRGYNETLAYGAYTGGPRNLVMMTLDQIDAMQTQMLRHPDNHFNSSAAGRYQIVQKTLRGLRDELGLSGDEFFTADLQDRLAEQLLRRRGNDVAGLRDEWQGLSRVDDATIRQAYDGTSVTMPVIDPGKAANIELARQQADAYADIVANAKSYTAQMGSEQQALTMTSVAAAALRYEQQMLNEAQRAGVEVTPQQRQEIQQLAMGMATAEQAAISYAETQAQAAEASRFFGQQAVDALTGVLTGTTSVEDALRNVLNSLVRVMLQAALLNEGPFAGLLGGKGFTGGTGGGGKAKAGLGFLGSIIGLAEGGHVRGPGTSTSDSIPAMLSDGEFVVRASQAQKHRRLLEAINSGNVARFAAGGVAGNGSTPLAAGIGGQVVNISAPVTVNGSAGTPEQNDDLARRMSKQLEATMRGVVVAEMAKQMRPGNMGNQRGR